MFNYNQNYLSQGIDTGGGAIKKSGCYPLTINEAYILKTDKTKSEALVIEFESLEEEKAKIQIWYKNKNGEEVAYNSKHITHLIDLLGINPQVATSTQYNENKKREEIPIFKEKIIGVILVYEGNEKYTGNDGKEYTRHNYNLKGFYDVNTKLTADEKNNNLGNKSYEYWINKFENEEYRKSTKEVENVETDDDDFPF